MGPGLEKVQGQSGEGSRGAHTGAMDGDECETDGEPSRSAGVRVASTRVSGHAEAATWRFVFERSNCSEVVRKVGLEV